MCYEWRCRCVIHCVANVVYDGIADIVVGVGV